jgi:hypothetical protein
VLYFYFGTLLPHGNDYMGTRREFFVFSPDLRHNGELLPHGAPHPAF